VLNENSEIPNKISSIRFCQRVIYGFVKLRKKKMWLMGRSFPALCRIIEESIGATKEKNRRAAA